MTYISTEEIIPSINRAKELYYQTGRSDLSDEEYDALVDRAKQLGYEETVGAEPVDEIRKITHEHPMLSLDKCHTIAEVQSFIGDNNVIVMDKADGLTISCTYIDGELTRLETRGNGETGNDIMFHADSIENLPKHIDKMGRYVIDGECVILFDDFEEINSTLPESEQYSNPRNLAAGSLNLRDANISKKRHLRFYAWDVIEGGIGSLLSINLLDACMSGFNTVNYRFINPNNPYDNIDKTINEIKHCADESGFPIDGIVIKYDDVKYGRSLGMTGHHPRNAIAFKFKDDTYPTKLKSVTWQVGKTGQITPVANFEPVEIDGSIVERASLHNITIMNSLGLTNGCTVNIKKCNMIIPQIDSAVLDGEGKVEIPLTCPICGASTKIVKDNNTEVLICSNDDCPGKLLGKYKTFVSKKGMDIDGLSEATLEKFLNLGYLTNMFVSIYELDQYKKELYKLDGFGKKSIDNLLASIEKSKDVDFIHFLAAFSIDGVGEGQSKLIVAKFHTFEEFSLACDDNYDFSKIPGIGPILNMNIHKWWMLNHMQMLDVANVVRFKNDANTNNSSVLNGKTFVITGSLNHYHNRDELKTEIESLGGKVAGSVSKNTDYLINNDVNSTSGKNKKAIELGVKIISEDEYINMINVQ